MTPNFQLEEKYISLGYRMIAGVDEVGRGALAGPLLAAAVVFDTAIDGLEELNDSKKLSSKKREELSILIREKALDWAIGKVEAEEIDSLGIGAANILAFQRALQGLKTVDFALIDGRAFRGFDYRFSAVVKGDSKSLSIAAASILAKVERDSLLCTLDPKQLYGFRDNAGYGTDEHLQAIDKYGVSPHHRKSFLQKHRLQSSNNKLF